MTAGDIAAAVSSISNMQVRAVLVASGDYDPHQRGDMFRCKACGSEGDFHMYDVMNKGLLVPLYDPCNEKRLK